MASRQWLRRRVHPFPPLRAPDGSAFEKCKKCGVSVAVALSDMHAYECRARRQRKRPRDYDFRKCEKCGVLFELELFVTHTFECGVLKQSEKEEEEGKEKEKGQADSGNEEKKLEVDSGVEKKKKQKFDIEMQPRSAFRFFMESFEKSCEIDDWLEVDRKGFQKWQEMSREERFPFVRQAGELDRAYQVMIEWEIRAAPGVKFIRDLTSYGNGDLGSDTHDSDWKDLYL